MIIKIMLFFALALTAVGISACTAMLCSSGTCLESSTTIGAPEPVRTQVQ